MLHAEVSVKPALLIQLIHMHDSLDPPPDRLDQSALLRELRGALGDMHRWGGDIHRGGARPLPAARPPGPECPPAGAEGSTRGHAQVQSTHLPCLPPSAPFFLREIGATYITPLIFPSPPLPPPFRIEVTESWLSFAHCDVCVTAYTSALKVWVR